MKVQANISDTTDSEDEYNVNGTLNITLDRKEIAQLIAEQYKPLLERYPDLKIQHLDTNLGDYTLFLDFCVETDNEHKLPSDIQEVIEWWLQHRHERPTGDLTYGQLEDFTLFACPYCEGADFELDQNFLENGKLWARCKGCGRNFNGE